MALRMAFLQEVEKSETKVGWSHERESTDQVRPLQKLSGNFLSVFLSLRLIPLIFPRGLPICSDVLVNLSEA